MRRIIYDPKPGIFDLEDDFITNIPIGEKLPPLVRWPNSIGLRVWKYFLFGRYKTNHHRVIIVLNAFSQEEIDRELLLLVEDAEIYT